MKEIGNPSTRSYTVSNRAASNRYSDYMKGYFLPRVQLISFCVRYTLNLLILLRGG